MTIRARLLIAPVACVLLAQVPQAAAQDALTQAKTLYASADYEQALALLEKSENSRDAHYYRALCLIALGRQEAAEAQIGAAVALDPMFVPGTGDVSPRVIAAFSDTRRRVLPQIARRTFNYAKELFQGGHRERAVEQFEATLRMLDAAGLDEEADLADLRLVASGFIDLAKVKAPPAASSPPPAVAAVSTTAPPVTAPLAAPPASAPAASRPATGGVASLPVTIDQTLPAWRPDGTAARRTYMGAVRVEIDATGRVTAAEIEKSVHAAYDPLVLQAARTWRYRPATLNGTPIASEKTVEIVLQPDRQEEEE
jgi:protein TonB